MSKMALPPVPISVSTVAVSSYKGKASETVEFLAFGCAPIFTLTNELDRSEALVCANAGRAPATGTSREIPRRTFTDDVDSFITTSHTLQIEPRDSSTAKLLDSPSIGP